MPDAAPLSEADVFRLSARVPAAHHAALVLVDNDGRVGVLARYPAAGAEQAVQFPESAGRRMRLTGGAGTALACVVASTGEFTEREVLALPWVEGGALPRAAADAVFLVSAAGVEVRRGRGVAIVEGRASPEDELRASLARLRSAAVGRSMLLAGVAFARVE